MNVLFRETIGYAAASACALLVDMSLLWILVHSFSWDYLTATTTSFLMGAVVAYHLSVRLAFKHHTFRDPRWEFATFVIIGIVGLGINEIVIYMAVTQVGLHIMLAKGVAAGFTFACNFALRRQILFLRRTST